jgi:hypothetical protein
VIIICTTHIQKLRILSTESICLFRVVLPINSDHFREQHEPTGLCSSDVMCFLWGTNWICIYYSDEFQSEFWRLPEPSDSKIWSWVPWESEPRITVLARASSNLAVSSSVSQSLKGWYIGEKLHRLLFLLYTVSCLRKVRNTLVRRVHGLKDHLPVTPDEQMDPASEALRVSNMLETMDNVQYNEPVSHHIAFV